MLVMILKIQENEKMKKWKNEKILRTMLLSTGFRPCKPSKPSKYWSWFSKYKKVKKWKSEKMKKRKNEKEPVGLNFEVI